MANSNALYLVGYIHKDGGLSKVGRVMLGETAGQWEERLAARNRIVEHERETGEDVDWQYLDSLPGLHSREDAVRTLMNQLFGGRRVRFIKTDEIPNFPSYPNREIYTFECTDSNTDRRVILVERSDGEEF